MSANSGSENSGSEISQAFRAAAGAIPASAARPITSGWLRTTTSARSSTSRNVRWRIWTKVRSVVIQSPVKFYYFS